MSDNKMGRREFLSYSAVLGAAGVVGLASCGKKETITPLRAAVFVLMIGKRRKQLVLIGIIAWVHGDGTAHDILVVGYQT